MAKSESHKLVELPTIIGLLIAVSGCVETRTIQLSEINPDADQRITVFSKDGRAIQFEHQEYKLETIGTEPILRGHGTVSPISGENAGMPFSGSIGFSQIDSVHARGFGAVGNALGLGIVIAGSAVVFALILAWIHGPISIG